MAVIRGINLNGQGANVDNSDFRDLSGFQVATNTSSQIALTFPSTAEGTIFNGSNLSLNEATGQASGTITSIAYQVNGQTIVIYEEASFDASTVVPFYISNDAEGYLNYLGAGTDSFIGSSAGELIRLYAGNDTFQGAGGDDQFFGGEGTDTAIFSGTRSEYTISGSSERTVVDSQSSRDGTDTLTDIERLQFSDGTLALDTSGTAGQTYRLYQAAFARTPDTEGLTHNIGLIDNGLSLRDMSSAFIGSAEFIQRYGNNTSDTVFINALYNNVLGRDADAAGLEGWQGRLADGSWDRIGVLIGFSESAENQALVGQAIQDGIWLA
jgi:Ca2+-binding RTX toxin-like protein